MDNTIIGQKITALRKMTTEELDELGWDDHHGTLGVIELESGDTIWPSRDDEGNGPGTLFGKVGGVSVYLYDES